jgi:uncharacterized protein
VVVNPLRRSEAPSIEHCYRLLEIYHVPHHIVQHSRIVCKVAGFLAVELNTKGENLSIPEIEAASLLHDVTKMEGLETRQDHAKTGEKLLIKLGFKRIGEIVAEHIKLKVEQNPWRVSEEEIINYSDKRVMHARVVSLAERFADLRKRYGAKGSNAIERIIALEDESYGLENKIFSRLDFTPDRLLDLMEGASEGR